MKQKRSNLFYHVIILIILTTGMYWVKTNFYISEEIDHPQFKGVDNYEEVIGTIISKGKLVWFYGFFMLDLVWSFMLIALFPHIYVATGQADKNFQSLVYFGALAWILDAIEGIFYVFGTAVSFLPTLLWLKLGAYGLVILAFITVLILRRRVVVNGDR